MDENGEVIRDSFSFNNDKEGFNTLLNVLNSLDLNQEKRIGFESTGHYGSNLKIFLERNGYSFMEFNPLLVHRHFKSETLRRTKNDKVDARKISSYLYTREYKLNPNSSYHLNCLKSLTRTREALIKERTRHIIHITNVLDKMFPEFKPQFNNQGLNASSAMYLLENYGSPSKMSNMTRASYDKMKSELRHAISYAKFLKIKELAKNTIGNEDEILVFELNTYLELFKELDKKILKVEDKITKEFSIMNCHIASIKGIGIITAAGILAEIESIDRFDNPGQLCAFAGIEPSENQSGTHDGGGKMVALNQKLFNVYLMPSTKSIFTKSPISSISSVVSNISNVYLIPSSGRKPTLINSCLPY